MGVKWAGFFITTIVQAKNITQLAILEVRRVGYERRHLLNSVNLLAVSRSLRFQDSPNIGSCKMQTKFIFMSILLCPHRKQIPNI